MSGGYVDPVLVALSDSLVITALERAFARTVSRSMRAHVRHCPRHESYRYVPIRPEGIEHGLSGAWDLCAEYAQRHRLDVDASRWAALLDQYTRGLIMTSRKHTLAELVPYLTPLALAHARAVNPYAVA